MTILMDTDVLAAFIHTREGRHEQASRLVRRVLAGAWGPPAVTDYVLDETLTILMARGAAPEAAERVLRLTMSPLPGTRVAPVRMLRVSDSAFEAAIALFRRHFRRGLSFTDCTSLSVAAERGFDMLASFDRGFDGLIARVDS